jgi:hypothetical protein
MNKIISPLKFTDSGTAVADLQDALLLLLSKGIIPIAQPERRAVEERVRVERANAVFGVETRKLVAAFQGQQQEPSERVDERTAALLNVELERAGALPPQRTPQALRPTTAQLAITNLLPLLRTSPSLRDDALLDRFAQLFVEKAAIAPGAWIPIASEAGLSAPQIEEARLTMELGSLTRYNLPLVAELQGLRQSGRIRDGRDLVDLSTDEWKALFGRASQTGQAGPDANPDTEFVAIMQARLRTAYPMAYVSKALAMPPPVDLALIRRVIAANPKLDLSSPPPKTLKLDELNAAERTAAETSLASLAREIRAYPDFDYRAALQSSAEGVDQHVNPIRVGVARLLSQARDFDLRASRIGKYVTEHPEALEGVEQPPLVIAQIKRMQRVYRVAPDVDAMNALMGEGIHSASRIVRMPAEVFVARFREALGGVAVAAKAYAAARSVTAATAAITWAARLRSAGPLPAAVGAWPPPALQVGDAELQRLLSPGGGRPVP